jgi:ABC-type oligopeptide transport system substrate-binding subunit
MKMKKKYILLIALFATLAIVPMACKKSFLTQTNTFSSTVESTFNKPQDVIALVTRIAIS